MALNGTEHPLEEAEEVTSRCSSLCSSFWFLLLGLSEIFPKKFLRNFGVTTTAGKEWQQ